MHHDLVELPRWGFAFPGRVRDELTAACLAGVKTGTAGLLAELEADGEAVPVAGERSVLLDSGERPVAIVETTSIRIVRLADVDDEHAISEGEGYPDAAAFRAEHERFWRSYLPDLRERLGDPAFDITDDTPVTAERLRVVVRLDEPLGDVAVRRAGPDRAPLLAAVLARAFARDPMTTWPLSGAGVDGAGGDDSSAGGDDSSAGGDDSGAGVDDSGAGVDGGLAVRIRDHFLEVDRAFAAEGWLWEAGDGLGAMTLLPPGYEAREAALAEAARPVIAALAPDGGARYDAFWAWVAAHNPGEPHWLLDQLAVEPALDGRGIGGALLRHAIALADADGRPMALETASEANVRWYARHGFRVHAEGDAPGGGPHTWFLRREPGGTPG